MRAAHGSGDQRTKRLTTYGVVGRTPTGKVHFFGLTNGQPPDLKFDVEVYPDLHTPR